jgi:hypothetical protein
MVVRGRGRFIGGHSEQAFGKTPTHRRDLAREDGVLGVLHRVALAAVALLEGFKGYYLIEAGDGVMSSLGLFESAEQARESTTIAASWVRDEKLETAFPNPPKITEGKVVAHKNGFATV